MICVLHLYVVDVIEYFAFHLFRLDESQRAIEDDGMEKTTISFTKLIEIQMLRTTNSHSKHQQQGQRHEDKYHSYLFTAHEFRQLKSFQVPEHKTDSTSV